MLPKLANNNEIVLVDDDLTQHLFIKKYAEWADLKQPLLFFSNGKDFLAYMEEVSKGTKRMPAIVLLDIRMPHLNGFDILKQIRHRSEFEKIPVIIMFSNSDAPSDIEKANELGADGYQTKPVGLKEADAFFKQLAP